MPCVRRCETVPVVLFVLLWTLSSCLFTAAEFYNQVCVTGCTSNISEHCYTYGRAKFAATLIQSIEAQLVVASPRNACQPIAPPPMNRQWFVLIDDGGCAADVKAYHAHSQNYDATIIRSLDSSSSWTISGSGRYDHDLRKDIVISVGKEGGDFLAKHASWSGCLVKITPQDIYWDIRFYLIPFAIIVGICFVLMAMFMISRYYRHFLEQRRSRLSPGKLRKIPTKKFKKGEDFYDVCAICLDEYENGDRLRILPCEHVYHCKCVDPWLTEGKRTCPVCKRSVETDSQGSGRQSHDVEGGQNSNSDEANETTPLISPARPSTPSRAVTV